MDDALAMAHLLNRFLTKHCPPQASSKAAWVRVLNGRELRLKMTQCRQNTVVD